MMNLTARGQRSLRRTRNHLIIGLVALVFVPFLQSSTATFFASFIKPVIPLLPCRSVSPLIIGQLPLVWSKMPNH